MFLVRAAFWLTLILLILPVDREAAGISEGPGALETLGAVQRVVYDVRGFCGRNPDTCATGAATVDVLRQKAVYSAGVVQGWLSEHDTSQVLPAALPAERSGETEGSLIPVQTQVPMQTQAAARSYVLDARLPSSPYPPL